MCSGGGGGRGEVGKKVGGMCREVSSTKANTIASQKSFIVRRMIRDVILGDPTSKTSSN